MSCLTSATVCLENVFFVDADPLQIGLDAFLEIVQIAAAANHMPDRAGLLKRQRQRTADQPHADDREPFDHKISSSAW